MHYACFPLSLNLTPEGKIKFPFHLGLVITIHPFPFCTSGDHKLLCCKFSLSEHSTEKQSPFTSPVNNVVCKKQKKIKAAFVSLENLAKAAHVKKLKGHFK